MSVNKYKPHIWVIPEDDADRQLVNGFLQYLSVDVRAVGINRPAGGWGPVLDVFEKEYVPYLRNNPLGHVVMLIDFDDKIATRMATYGKSIPDDLKARVFVLGSAVTPEVLRSEFNLSLEKIGEGLAGDCLREDCGRWVHAHLRHNRDELLRMADVIKLFIFAGG